MTSRTSIATILTGQDLLSLIENGNTELFTEFYLVNFRKLILVSERYVQSIPTAEEIVQDVFLRIWEDKAMLAQVKSIKSYLYRSVVNSSINFVNRQKNIERHHLNIADNISTEDLEMDDAKNALVVLLYDEIQQLPEKCRLVFKLSRLEGLKYRDIALQLNISEKTVEGHMTNALKTLRSRIIQHSEASDGKKRFNYLSLLAIYLY